MAAETGSPGAAYAAGPLPGLYRSTHRAGALAYLGAVRVDPLSAMSLPPERREHEDSYAP
jgi:hypothetical protein